MRWIMRTMGRGKLVPNTFPFGILLSVSSVSTDVFESDHEEMNDNDIDVDDICQSWSDESDAE